jgi:hypothetical protein
MLLVRLCAFAIVTTSIALAADSFRLEAGFTTLFKGLDRSSGSYAAQRLWTTRESAPDFVLRLEHRRIRIKELP